MTSCGWRCLENWPYYSGHLVWGGSGGRGRGCCGEPVCHLDFASEVPDYLC